MLACLPWHQGSTNAAPGACTAPERGCHLRLPWHQQRRPPTPAPPPPPLLLLQGNINVIEAAAKKGVKKFILVTSIGCGETKASVGEQIYNALQPVLVEKDKAEQRLMVGRGGGSARRWWWLCGAEGGGWGGRMQLMVRRGWLQVQWLQNAAAGPFSVVQELSHPHHDSLTAPSHLPAAAAHTPFPLRPRAANLTRPQELADKMPYTIIRPGGLKSEAATGNGILTADVSAVSGGPPAAARAAAPPAAMLAGCHRLPLLWRAAACSASRAREHARPGALLPPCWPPPTPERAQRTSHVGGGAPLAG
jgi:hypothetical protein